MKNEKITEEWLLSIGFNKNELYDYEGYYLEYLFDDSPLTSLYLLATHLDKDGFVKVSFYDEKFVYEFKHEVETLIKILEIGKANEL